MTATKGKKTYCLLAKQRQPKNREMFSVFLYLILKIKSFPVHHHLMKF